MTSSSVSNMQPCIDRRETSIHFFGDIENNRLIDRTRYQPHDDTQRFSSWCCRMIETHQREVMNVTHLGPVVAALTLLVVNAGRVSSQTLASASDAQTKSQAIAASFMARNPSP